MWLSAIFAIVAILVLGAAMAFRFADQERLDDARRHNCRAIEQLKGIERGRIAADIEAARKFLREHPQGSGVITPALIREGINRDRHQLRALAPRPC